ncbi:MBOAT family protein [Pseudoflavonifractor phocaeensis]|nr:MBOAT family protein [Pseudoflavonifractor phocaeensis]
MAFFCFFPVVMAGWILLPARPARLWLLGASWLFALWSGPEALLSLLCATVVTYGGALALERVNRGKKALLTLLLLCLFGALFLFKYLGFACTLLTGLGWPVQAPALFLPAGISFYLFMAAGYLVDVYRGKHRAARSFVDTALLLAFFPQLLSGPIGRAKELMPQLRTGRAPSWDGLRLGAFRFLWGAFKKLVIADRLGLLVSTVYADPAAFGRLQVIAAACAFSIQIYCDFSAYSDMALGCARMLGVELMENFKTPYFSRSIAEFWRRWHISLSSWFRDYLYIPLGGSRKGVIRKYRNVLIVFAVSGLWHGAALTFLVWGLLNGLYQVAGDLTARHRASLRRALRLGEDSPLTAGFQMLWTFLLSTAAWVFFKAESLGKAAAIFAAMVRGPWLTHPVTAWGLDRPELVVAGLALLLFFFVEVRTLRRPVGAGLLDAPRPLRWAAALLLAAAVLVFGIYGTGYDAQDFIYFKF